MPSETEARMRCLLAEAGLLVANSDPLRVWAVFKQFAIEPMACAGDYLLFQAGDSKVASDTYFDFCREFKQYSAEGVPWYEQLHVEFSTQPPHRLGIAPVALWSDEFGSTTEFFAAVEQLPQFRAGVSFPHWSFRVYHTGV